MLVKATIDPLASVTTDILKNIKDRYENHHNVNYSDDALCACVDLTDRYMSDRFLPDKAIDVIDETGSMINVNRSSNKKIKIKKKDTLKINEKFASRFEHNERRKEEHRLKEKVGKEYLVKGMMMKQKKSDGSSDSDDDD